ncbi:MAG TPA: asparaginase [Pyrinomonadaceae bacterium]|nr:asparaginase [Pyrinomonadaceae bacterium]
MPTAVLANVTRGETVESVHRGHAIAIIGDGETVMSLGSPETVTFFRSACKPFQALPFITSGACDALGYSEEEIALACASHSGEARHVRVAQLMLERAELSEAYLRCGSHLPFNEKESERMLRAGEHPNQLHNNCSGKHAAMLAFAKHIGAELADYDSIDNPIQQAILETIALFSGVSSKKIKIGTDGCAAPNFALPISAMARTFLNLIRPPDDFPEDVRAACSRLVSAMSSFPELIGGNERLDTILMQAAPGKIISKVGADGVWLCAILPDEKWPTGLAIALKVEDGDDRRARPVIAVELLKKFGVLASDDLPELSPMQIKNRRGDVVGNVSSIPFE